MKVMPFPFTNKTFSLCTAVALAFAIGSVTHDAHAEREHIHSSQAASNTDDALLDLSIEELSQLKITTASRKAEAALDAPATAYVVTQQEIRERGYAVLGDVLKDLPGMETVEYYFSEVGTLAAVRGVVGNNKIIVLVNGMRINPPGGEEQMMRLDMSIRMAEQIEVVYGPGSTLYGQDAISAVINIVTRKPVDGEHGELLGSIGTESYREGFAAFAEQIDSLGSEPVGISGYISAIDTDPTDIDNTYSQWWQNYEEVAQGIGDGTSANRWDEGYNAFLRFEQGKSSIQGWYRESSRSSSEGGFVPVLFYVDEAEWRDRSFVVEGKHVFPLTDSIELESTLTYNKYDIDEDSRYVFPISETEFFLNDFKYGVGKGLWLEEKLNVTLSDDLYLTAGAAYSDYDIVPKSTVPGGVDVDNSIFPQAGSLTYFTRPGDPTSSVVVPRTTNLLYDNWGVFLEGHYNPTPEISITAGGRVDVNSRYDDNPISPRFSALYRVPDTSLTAKYIFTEAFVAPAPYFEHNVFDNGVAINTINPDLDPEEAISHEFNLTWAEEQMLISGSFYYNQQDNLLLVGDLALPPNIVSDEIYLDEAGTVTRILTQSANSGDSTAKGFDLFARYNSEMVSAWASYSYVDFESKIGNLTTGLPQISESNIRFGLTFRPREDLSITPSLVYRTTPENITSTFGLDSEIDDPYEVNLHVVYTPVEDLDIFADFRNLTDNEYALKGLSGPMPQETFRLRGGLRWRFN